MLCTVQEQALTSVFMRAIRCVIIRSGIYYYRLKTQHNIISTIR